MTRTQLRWLASLATAMTLSLSACGGSDSEDAPPETPAAPQTPAPKFTYTPDPHVCSWMTANVTPFRWPAERVGPRLWPEVAPIVTYAHPARNPQGTPLYTLTSNEWVLSENYDLQARALGVLETPTGFWAQQVACDHQLTIVSAAFGALRAYMSDEAAARIAREQYAARLSQTDLCAPGATFTGPPPRELPPECNAPAQ